MTYEFFKVYRWSGKRLNTQLKGKDKRVQKSTLKLASSIPAAASKAEIASCNLESILGESINESDIFPTIRRKYWHSAIC